MQQEKLTIEQALEVVGQALSHESLKLSQREHIIIIEAFNTLKNEITKKDLG
jgi:hypothetical protein